MAEEMELKLAMDAGDLPRLRKSAILRAASTTHTGRSRRISIYYDTPSFSLKRSAIVLSVRGNGRERVQAVEMAPARLSGLTRRIRSEDAIRGNQPSLEQIRDDGIRRVIEKRCGAEKLVPVFTTDVKRETWLLRLGRSQITCAVNRGSVRANGKSAPIVELELELKSGQPARLFQLAHRLNEIVPLRLEPESEVARGYALAKGRAPGAVPAAPVHLDRAWNVGTCLAAIAQAGLAGILANAEYAYESDDPEGVHQLRVAIRRLRAALSLFRGAVARQRPLPIEDELRAIQQKFGAARDWDVLVEDTLAPMPKPLRKSAAPLIHVAEIKSVAGHREAHAALRGRDCTNLLLRLGSWVDQRLISLPERPADRTWNHDVLAQPIARFAAEVLSVQHAKVRKLGKRVGELDSAGLHRLRIRIKKLRYATEFFRDLWPGRKQDRYLAALKQLQQTLGTLHDETVAPQLIAQLAEAAGPEGARVAPDVDAWLAGRRRRHRKRAIALWSGFAGRKVFWAPN